ncbi:MAG TPA: STAS domain-containing protein [Burkholderiaceae bacterium]|nr:STAS domain-containing protein [Burkholderiaceae bacterium]
MKIDEDSLTSANATRVLEAGLAAIRGGDLEIDLSRVGRCDSSAVALLLAWRREARARRVTVTFDGVPADLKSLAALYGVDTLIA